MFTIEKIILSERRKKEEEARELESIDPTIAELMGFSGFGGPKK